MPRNAGNDAGPRRAGEDTVMPRTPETTPARAARGKIP